MPNFSLRPAEIDDYEELAAIDRNAFFVDEHPYIESMYQHQRTDEGLANKVALWKSAHGSSPNAITMKVIDEDKHVAVLVASALLPCSENDLESVVCPPKLGGRFWDTEDDKAWAEWLTERYTQRRRNAFSTARGQVFAITHMAVDPNYQRQGAGTLFIAWIIAKADAVGSQCVVEASLRAEHFYKNHGFTSVEICSFSPPPHERRWSGKGTQNYVWMIREANSAA